MERHWHIEDRDIARVKKVIKDQADNPRVVARQQKNLFPHKPAVRKAVFWSHMVRARLTTQNRVGPGSPVTTFAATTPFPLAYASLRSKRTMEHFIAETVRQAGIGKFNQIAHDLAVNWHRLKSGEWERALQECNRLTTLVEMAEERRVATYIDETFRGFAPKQARNLLQQLGLTRYEIPIDGRLSRWLNPCLSPVALTSTLLDDRAFYVFVLDGIQELCRRSGTVPCLFDAAVIAAMERR